MRTLQMLTIGVLAFSTSASAQSKALGHKGFTASMGLGGGSAAVTCAGCATSPRESALSGYLRLGGAVTPSLIIAGETNGWTKTINGTDTRLGSLMAVAQWYPSLTNGFFVKAGAGLGSYTESDPTGDLKVMGFGYQGGMGYDVRISRNFSLTPYANYIGMADAQITVNNQSTQSKMGTNNMQYGLGFTWH